MEREPIDSTPEKSEKEIFMDKVKNASPSTIEKIKETMKRPETWFGTFMLAGGGFLLEKVFGTDQEIAKETIEVLNSNTEAIRETLNWLKAVAIMVTATGGLTTLLGISKGIHNAKENKVLEEEHKQE